MGRKESNQTKTTGLLVKVSLAEISLVAMGGGGGGGYIKFALAVFVEGGPGNISVKFRLKTGLVVPEELSFRKPLNKYFCEQ